MSEPTIGKNADIDETVKFGKDVIIRDNVNLRHVVLGDGVKIGRNTVIFGSEKKPVEIGAQSYISPNCYFNGAEGLYLEEKVTVAAGVMIFTDSGPNVGPLKEYYPTESSKIRIGNGAWIGAGCILLPGAGLDKESILAANSTLTSKVGFHEIYGGNLAKLIKKIDV